ncbi:MAG TPA: hypothetical protein VIU44_10255 [Gaiellaceae bacterium]
MPITTRFRPSPALVVASLALGVALGGTGYAAVVLPANSVGTAQLKNGAVVGSKVKPHSLPATSLKGPLPKGDPGPVGLAGPAGPAGPKGDAATKLWAVVRGADGAVIRQSGGIGVTTPAGAGKYVVTFPQSVNACAPVVTLSGTGATPDEGSGSAAVGAQPTQLNVQTLDSGGAHSNETFSIAVFC